MLMQVESEVLNRVLDIIEDHIDVPGLRRSNRTTINGLRAVVTQARRDEEARGQEAPTTTVAGCVACGVFNDVQRCRECGHDLTMEPIVVRDGDMAEAAQRLEGERARERERQQAEARERVAARRASRGSVWQSLTYDPEPVGAGSEAEPWDNVYWQGELDRYIPIAQQAGRRAPTGCGLPLSECGPCQAEARMFVQREQRRVAEDAYARDVVQQSIRLNLDQMMTSITREETRT